MGAFDKDPVVVSIKARARSSRIDLDMFIGEITNTWKETPMGFGFTCKNPNGNNKGFNDLMMALALNKQHFGLDNMIGGSQHQGASFRENSHPDSLHIILSRRPDPKMSNGTCSIHLDSVSVVLEIDQKTGMVKYDMGKVLQHLTSDLLHTPLVIVPGTDGIFQVRGSASEQTGKRETICTRCRQTVEVDSGCGIFPCEPTPCFNGRSRRKCATSWKKGLAGRSSGSTLINT